MKSAVVLLVSACIFLALPSLGNARQPMLTVRDISYTKAGDGTEQVGIALSSEALPAIFLIDGDKPRLVLDFADSDFTGRSPAVIKSGGLVRGIRVGVHNVPKQKIRIVIDLAPGRNVKWNKEFIARENLLRISISERNHAAPTAPVTAPAQPAAPSAPAPAAPAAPVTAITPEAPATATVPAVPAALTPTGKTQPPAPPPPVIARGYSKIKVLPQPEATPGQTSEPPPAAAPAPSTAIAEKVDAAAGGEKATSAEQPESGPVLLDVSFDNAFTRSGEMVLLKLDGFKPPKITAEEKDPPRIFCDFAGARIGDGVRDVNDAGGKYVEKIRVLRTENPSAVRVTLDLAVGNNYDLQQVFFKEDNLFVLIVNALEKE